MNVKVTVAMKMRGLPEPIETSEVIQETWIKDTAWKSEWRYVKIKIFIWYNIVLSIDK